MSSVKIKLSSGSSQDEDASSSPRTPKETSPQFEGPSQLIDLDSYEGVEELSEGVSESSGSGLGFSQATYTPEELAEATAFLKAVVALGAHHVLDPKSYPLLQKAVEALVVTQALGGADGTKLQDFYKELPRLKSSYAAAKTDFDHAKARLKEMEEQRQALQCTRAAYKITKVEVQAFGEKCTNLDATIERLEKELAQAKCDREELPKEKEAIVAKQNQLLADATVARDKFNALFTENLGNQASKEKAEGIMDDVAATWDTIRVILARAFAPPPPLKTSP